MCKQSMTILDEFQYVSLIISIIVVIAMIIVAKKRKNARLFYFSMIFGWIPGIIYYIGVLFFYNEFLEYFNLPAKDASAMLRTYQYLIFGGWFTLDALSIIYSYVLKKITVHELFQKIKNFKSRNIL